MSEGRVFQSVGVATEKDLAPYVFKLKCGIELFHPGMSFTPGRLSSHPRMSLSFRCLVIHL